MTGADVEALSRSFRSRVLLLVLLVLGGLAAAVWSSTRKTGIGEAEDRRRLMVVTGDSDIDYYAVLERAGFAVEVDDFDDWLAEARAAAPDSEAEGVALLLELADLRGFGLVVFEAPSALDFDGLELEPTLDSVDRLDERDYAVLSVGDFAFPHRLTLDEPGEDPRVRLPGYGALEAVFRQELINSREDGDRPTVEELQFEDATSLGRQMFEGPAGFEAVISSIQMVLEAELDDGSGAKSLLPTLETGTAMLTPDGGVLVFHHELVIYSDNARSLELEAGSQMQFSWLGPEALATGFETGEFQLEPCASLAGGGLPMADLSRLQTAVDGSAVALGTPEGDMVVWRKVAPGCEWAPVAELDASDELVLAPQLTNNAASLSVAAQVERDGVGSRVLIAALDDAKAVGEGEHLDPTLLLEGAGRRFSRLAFVDDRHLAVVSEVEADESSAQVYLLDRARPGLYLSVPVDSFAERRTLRELITLAPASDEAGPELLIAAQNRIGRIELFRLRIGADAWAAFANAAPLGLTPEQFEAEVLLEVDRLYGVSVAAGSLIYAGSDGPHASELVVLDLESRASRRLTDNEVRDYLPRLAADGSYATFVSLKSVSISPTPFSVPRVLRIK